MSNAELAWIVVLAVAAVFGIHDSWAVTRRYITVKDELDWRGRMLLLLLVVICWSLTATALWFGAISARRLLGFQPIPNVTIPVSFLIVTGVLFLPRLILSVIRAIEAALPPKRPFRRRKEDHE